MLVADSHGLAFQNQNEKSIKGFKSWYSRAGVLSNGIEGNQFCMIRQHVSLAANFKFHAKKLQ